jgi:hypothetical protein
MHAHWSVSIVNRVCRLSPEAEPFHTVLVLVSSNYSVQYSEVAEVTDRPSFYIKSDTL